MEKDKRESTENLQETEKTAADAAGEAVNTANEAADAANEAAPLQEPEPSSAELDGIEQALHQQTQETAAQEIIASGQNPVVSAQDTTASGQGTGVSEPDMEEQARLAAEEAREARLRESEAEHHLRGRYDDDDYDDEGYYDDYEDDEPEKKSHLGLIIYLVLLAFATAAAVYYVRKTGFEFSMLNKYFQPQVVEPETTAPPAEEVWKMDVDSDVNQLVRAYYVALQLADMDRLNDLTDESVTVDQASVEAAAKYIEGYQNIKCYVADGKSEGEQGLYVVYDIKFRNISTTAPGLVPAYVRRNAAGAPKLIPYENFDDQITAYMTSLSSDNVIASIRTDVTENYNNAKAADPVLAQFVTDLENGVINIPEAPDGAAAAQEPATEEIEGILFTVTDVDMWTKDSVRVRRTPNTDSADNVVTTLTPQTKVHVTGTSDFWYRITLENGEGPYFAAGQYLEGDSSAAVNNAAENSAVANNAVANNAAANNDAADSAAQNSTAG